VNQRQLSEETELPTSQQQQPLMRRRKHKYEYIDDDDDDEDMDDERGSCCRSDSSPYQNHRSLHNLSQVNKKQKQKNQSLVRLCSMQA
jgi:hypothetical protein